MEEIDFKDTWKRYEKWVRREWFTMIAIIIILILVLVDLGLVQDRIVDTVKKCNTHWKGEISGKCPSILENATWINLDENG
jgi:hypothetical protein